MIYLVLISLDGIVDKELTGCGATTLALTDIFLPIIQKFMVDALTDNLYVMEGGKLVKQ